MALSNDFAAAQERVRTLRRTPAREELLRLYALYKQGSLGDVQGPRPSLLDFKGRAKFDAWSQVSGMRREAAMQGYIQLVETLAVRYGEGSV